MHALFWLVMARVAGLFTGAPVFSLAALPGRYRILLSAILAASLVPAASASAIPTGTQAFVAAMVGEFAIGMSIGLLARFLLGAFHVAGSVMGFQMGLAMANALDPTTQDQSSVMGTLYLNMAGVIFVFLDGHHFLIRGLAASYESLPIGAPLQAEVLTSVMFESGKAIWDIGARVAAPVTGIMLLINGILGFLNRVNPQLSIFNIGFPLAAAAGFIAALLAIPGSIEAFVRATEGLHEQLLDLLGT